MTTKMELYTEISGPAKFLDNGRFTIKSMTISCYKLFEISRDYSIS